MIHVAADIGNAAIWISSVAIVVWTVQYSLLARWYKNPIGISLVGMEVVLLAIYAPTLMALADPADYASFAQTRWYLWLTIGVVVATTAFILTRIVTWELIRRQRGSHAFHTNGRVAELEAEIERLREQLESRSLIAA